MRLHFSVGNVQVDGLGRYISNLPQPRGWEKKIAEGPPCVVLASPGFMQSGTSRELFELWAPDSRNGLIVTGYSVEGTLARVSVKWLAFRDRYVRHLYITRNELTSNSFCDYAELSSFSRNLSQFFKLIFLFRTS